MAAPTEPPDVEDWQPERTAKMTAAWLPESFCPSCNGPCRVPWHATLEHQRAALAEKAPTFRERIRELWRPLRQETEPVSRKQFDRLLAVIVEGVEYMEELSSSAQSAANQAEESHSAAEKAMDVCEAACDEARGEATRAHLIRRECEEILEVHCCPRCGAPTDSGGT